MPDFVNTAVKEIEDQIRALKDEASRLEAARAALTSGSPRRGRPAGSGAVRTQGRSGAQQDGRSSVPRRRGGGSTRANEALELVRSQPGITIPEIARAMKIQPNYLYRVLPRLASDGEITREGQGWHPATGSTSTRSNATPRRRSQRAGSETPAPTPRTPARRSTGTGSATNGRTARGATTASVLAALVGGEAMTAGQVATKAGLARPTVSTTLSKLTKSGQIKKAERGYRLASTT